MSYTPPAYTDAGGNILTGYTPPAYTDAGGDVVGVLTLYPSSIAPIGFGTVLVEGTASFAPDTWESSAFGGASVINFHSFADPTGFTEEAFGDPLVLNWMQYVTPSGILEEAYGDALVANLQQFIANGGWESSELGTPTVFDPLQYVLVEGVAAPIFPTHYVADYYQYIDLAGLDLGGEQLGTPFVAFRVRYVAPPWFYTNAFGTPTVVAVSITPDTWRSHVVATGAVVTHSERAIDGYGVASASAVPWPMVFNKNAYLRQKGWHSLQVQSPTVFNRTQYVGADPYALNSPPNTFGLAVVANRNRTLYAANFVSSRMGRRTDTYVENAARAVAPAGLDSLMWGPETFISHYIRYVLPEPWQSSRLTRWGIVYNDAFLVEPLAIGPTSRFGRPDPVFSNLQTVVQYNVSGQTTFGTAFVAYRIRTVYPADITYPTAFFPTVRWNPQPIKPAGILPDPLDRQFGHVVLSRFMRNARPNSLNVHQVQWVGNPRVENRNRVLRPQPVVRGEYGRARVFNKDQYSPTGGETFLRFGATVVEFRTRRVTVSGTAEFDMPFTHWIRNAIADPPGTQLVEPGAIYLGIESNAGAVSSPTVHANSLYPSGILSFASGTAIVRGNDIRPRSITDMDKFGDALVSSTQWLYPESMPVGLLPGLSVVAQPRVSPHTIYAPFGDRATPQARENNPASGTPHVVGCPGAEGRWSSGGGWPWFGLPDVSTSPRFLVPEVINQFYPRFGVSVVEHRLRYLRPVAIRGPRFGPVTILNVPQFVGFDEDTPGYLDESVIGAHVVSRPPANPQIIGGVGDDLSDYGDHLVELQNREVAPTGIPHQGNPQQGFEDPWGNATVGFPREYELTLGVQTLWGTLVIEYLNRQVSPTGWESLTLVDDSLNDFRYRMRVTRRNPASAASGIPTATGVGTPTISFRVRSVVVQPIRALRPGVATIGMTVAPMGWDSTVFGDIDQWEAGTVKPHGDEMVVFPSPRFSRGVTLSVGGTSAVGEPRMARRVIAGGFPPPGFDGPSVTDEFGCSRRVVTVWPIQPPTTPAPTVTQ